MALVKTPSGMVRHLWPERAGFTILRESGLDCYTFLHFHNSVEILIKEGEPFVTKPHACFVYPPHVKQYFFSQQPLIHDWMHFDTYDAERWVDCGLELSKIYYPQKVGFITDTMARLETEVQQQNSFYEKYIDMRLGTFFIEFSRACHAHSAIVVSEKTKELFRTLRLNMLTRLDEKWTVERMSESLNLSTSYFQAVYKDIYAISPIMDIINARIFAAKNMLKFGDEPIGEIAAALGYDNASHFSRQFKKITGVAPSHYRK